ncbi:hypothetical protein BLOT_009773 [Blomia tropicalis]|nr:hypothetical protein BLOT_011342 [Blomia tropicalis]KAI2800076.1 hypothetical protein BLOT_012291 [Blomia tropicalis]KAI2801952.1 hypothetical protein BLOT_009773 [Blomia tropicalis]
MNVNNVPYEYSLFDKWPNSAKGGKKRGVMNEMIKFVHIQITNVVPIHANFDRKPFVASRQRPAHHLDRLSQHSPILET